MTEDTRPTVFVNCCFSPQGRELFDAIMFTLAYFDFKIVIASMRPGHGITRMEFLRDQIEQCFLIVSELTPAQHHSGLTMRNTSFEYGIAIGARRDADCLTFVSSESELLETFTDMRGFDVEEHGGEGAVLVRKLAIAIGLHRASWIKSVPDLLLTKQAYLEFRGAFEVYCQRHGLEEDDNVAHRVALIEKWVFEKEYIQR